MISCILGSKDRVDKMKALLESVYSNYASINCEPDIIIIDGGSKSDFIDYLKSCRGVTLIQENGLHGVTRAYNRGFRLAKYKYLTWLSDDLVLNSDLFKLASDNLVNIGDMDVLSMSMNNNDGAGWHVYKDITPVGFCTKELMKKIDYWSEDYITYASDLDFCLKALSIGGIMRQNPALRMNHYMDHKDELHVINTSGNLDTQRYRGAWVTNGHTSDYHLSKRIYPNIFINSTSAENLLDSVQRIWATKSWCNIYTNNLWGMSFLKAMNVSVIDDPTINFHVRM